MIHDVRGGVFGTAEEIRKYLDGMEVYNESVIDIYQSNMSVSREEIVKMMKAETYFSATEAVEVGLATHTPKVRARATPQIAAWFRSPPEDLVAQCKDREIAKIEFPRRAAARIRAKMLSRAKMWSPKDARKNI